MSIYEYDEERELKLMLADERELGIQQGIQSVAEIVIMMSKELGNSREKTVELLMEKCNLKEKGAEAIVDKWWN